MVGYHHHTHTTLGQGPSLTLDSPDTACNKPPDRAARLTVYGLYPSEVEGLEIHHVRPWTRTSDSHKQVCTEVRSSQRSGRQPAAEGLPSKSQVSSEKEHGTESLCHQESVVAKIQSGITGQSKGVEKCDLYFQAVETPTIAQVESQGKSFDPTELRENRANIKPAIQNF